MAEPGSCWAFRKKGDFNLVNQESIPAFQAQTIIRRLTSILVKRLSQTPVVALLGSRQVGKTTLGPMAEMEIGVWKLRSHRHHQKITRPTAMPHYDCGSHFGTTQIREWDRQQNHIIA
jgi:hypothetical protein